MAASIRQDPADVDVILPTHRGRAWVDEAIASVLAQSHAALHLFVVDDASDDGTFQHVCARWSEEPRLTALSLETPRRAAGARMEAAAAGDAEWIAFIDQDDRWHPEKLARQLACAAEQPGCGAVHTDCEHIDAQGRALPGSARRENAARARVDWSSGDRDELLRSCFEANRIRLASALVRRSSFEAVGGFDTELFGGEDWDLWVRLASAGIGIAHLAEPLLERRVHPEATSTARRGDRMDGLYRACQRAVDRAPELAPLRGARLEALLRREIESAGGAAARRRLRVHRDALSAAARCRVLGRSLLASLMPRALGAQHQSAANP